MFEGVERAVVAVSVVDAQGGEQLEDLLLDGRVGRVEGRRQLGHILAVLDDVVEPDARIHDALQRRHALQLQLQLQPSPVVVLLLVDLVAVVLVGRSLLKSCDVIAAVAVVHQSSEFHLALHLPPTCQAPNAVI